MSEIIQFPIPDTRQKSDLDALIDETLSAIPWYDREKLRFELLKTIDSYDGFFTEWPLSLPEESNESFRKQIYDIAHQEHARKLRMLKDIVRLKIKVLVAEYHQRN